MTDLTEDGNCAYLDNVSIEIAEQFQIDNPHLTVFYQGLVLAAAVERIRDRTPCDFDPAKRARKRIAGIPLGTPGHLFAMRPSTTIH